MANFSIISIVFNIKFYWKQDMKATDTIKMQLWVGKVHNE